MPVLCFMTPLQGSFSYAQSTLELGSSDFLFFPPVLRNQMDDSQSGEYSGHFPDFSSQPPRPSDYSPEADSCVAKISDILNVFSRSPYADSPHSPDDSEEHKVTVPRLRLKESTTAQISEL